MTCPDENVLGELARGDLDPSQRAEVEAHLDECEACSDVVAELARIFASAFADDAMPPEPDPEPSMDGMETTVGDGHPDREQWPTDLPLPEGAKLGRYVVLRAIGAGAMGIVYAAYDPQLDRRVALKLLRRSLDAASLDPGDSQSSRNKRLMREAQALARLKHPHTITVHDVGTFEGQVFLAMEFVEGGTLTDWLRGESEPRPWRDVRRVFRQAGEGLAAAHEAGLVHRDFKPDNVLRHGSGRAVVTDFGLARPLGATPDPEAVERTMASGQLAISGSNSALNETLTQTGALVGTPAYMAPEQLDGRRSDAKSDQFGFCVALYEGLYGERPFEGRTLTALISSVHEQRIRPAPRGSQVPRWLRRAVLRGLSVRPEDRYPDMRTLLAALRRKQLGRWQSVAAMGVMSVAASAAAISLMPGPAAAPAEPAAYCDDVAAKLAGVWDDDQRRAMRGAFVGTGLPFAEDAATRVRTHLDDYAARWVTAQADACRSEVEGHEPVAVVAVRMTCLAERRSMLAAMGQALAQADADVVMQSINAVQSLASPEDCADPSALGRSLPPVPAAEQEAVAVVRSAIAESTTLRTLGKTIPARDKAIEADEAASALSYGPVKAEARVERAITLFDAGDVAGSEASLHQALALAIATDHDRTVAHVASSLAHLEDSRAADAVAIERWVEIGRAALQSLGGRYPVLQASLAASLGSAQRRAGDYEAALATLEQVLRMRREHFGPDHYSLAEPLSGMGIAYGRLGDHARSVEYIERARALLGRLYGELHPNYAVTLHNLATAHFVHGYYVDALALYQEAHRLFSTGLGDQHPSTGVLAYNLASTLVQLERYDEALEYSAKAQAIEREVYGPRSRPMAISWSLVGDIHQRAGQFDDARAALSTAVDIITEAEPDDATRRAQYRARLGYTLLSTGRVAEAERHLAPAFAQLRGEASEPDADVGEIAGWLAMVRLAQGRHEDARTLIDTALEQIEASNPDGHYLAEARFRRAQILEAAGDRAEARAAAERARAFYTERADQPAHLSQVEDWLTNHP